MGVMCTALLNAIRQISERLWKFFCLLPPAADIRRVNLRNAASGCASLRFRDSRAAGFGYPGGYVRIRPNAGVRYGLHTSRRGQLGRTSWIMRHTRAVRGLEVIAELSECRGPMTPRRRSVATRQPRSFRRDSTPVVCTPPTVFQQCSIG